MARVALKWAMIVVAVLQFIWYGEIRRKSGYSEGRMAVIQERIDEPRTNED